MLSGQSHVNFLFVRFLTRLALHRLFRLWVLWRASATYSRFSFCLSPVWQFAMRGKRASSVKVRKTVD